MRGRRLVWSALLLICASACTSPRHGNAGVPAGPPLAASASSTSHAGGPSPPATAPPVGPQPTATTARVQVPPRRLLQAFSFADPLHGWVGGSVCPTPSSDCTAWIAATTNAGEDWHDIWTGKGTVQALDFVTLDEGWVVTKACAPAAQCTQQILWHTTDGGRTWQAQYHDPGLPDQEALLGPVDFVDGRNGWLVVDGAFYDNHPKLLRTSDGGDTWTPVVDPCVGSGLAGLSFTSAQAGFAVCAGMPSAGFQNKAVYTTADGGAQWRRVVAVGIQPRANSPLSGAGYVNGLGFGSPSSGWMALARAGLLRTTDGGREWHDVRSPSLPFTWASAVESLGGGRVLALVNQGSAAYLYATADAGAHWRPVYPPPAPTAPLQIFPSGAGVAAAANVGGPAVMWTQDGGKTWTQPGAVPGAGQLQALSFANPNVGWVLDASGLWSTTDGGGTWTHLKSVPAHALSLDLRTPADGYVVTGGGGLYITTDGGRRFALVAAGAPIDTVDFVDAATAWGVGQNGIFQTTDGGSAWQRRSSRTMWDGRPFFQNGQTGVVAGLSGVLRTTNGGETWAEVRWPSGAAAPSGISFTGGQDGWAVTTPGIVLRTTDGGLRWTAAADALPPAGPRG